MLSSTPPAEDDLIFQKRKPAAGVHLRNQGTVGRQLLDVHARTEPLAPGGQDETSNRVVAPELFDDIGERIPPPPPEVPELPNDESKLGELTLREVLAKHREHKSCAGCHDRFDSIGVAFEGFGPIGERRSVDLGGRPIETAATLPDGVAREGVSGLRDYLRQQRQDEFMDNLCRKLLSYALGRTLIVADDVLLRRIQDQVVDNDHRFISLVESIVTSPPFLNQRGRNYRYQE